ncbi:bile acid:sodium symporter family protein [Reinekea blandensis]|uniref:bile acid:sodium symporter family protein n=1 Tax=Reinekea blandensis TaxID=374838 RepID=UPI000325AA11|nr:bile acid:sodium symporter family protein [Reinekea blandensis]
MQALVSQVLLPVVLAAVMLGMGLGLKGSDFARVVKRPKASLLGFAMQMLFLPVLALLIIWVLPLSAPAAAGLFLVSLCPGGATSNLFSFIARGDVALSVTLTGIISLLSPIILPIVFIGYLQFAGADAAEFALPLIPAMKQLALVTLVPVAIGMSIRYFAPQWSVRTQPLIKKIATVAMMVIIIALMATNLNVVQSFLSLDALAVLTLSTASLLIAFKVAGYFRLPAKTQRTLAIEVGVQNAGTAMMVALAIMHRPELAFVPLMYGLLMNIPAFAFVAWTQKYHKDEPVTANA